MGPPRATTTSRPTHGPQRKEPLYRSNYALHKTAREQRDDETRYNLDIWFGEKSANPNLNVFWGMPHCDAYQIHRPDLLHNIYLGMYDHIINWVNAFVERHKRKEEFDDAWVNVPECISQTSHTAKSPSSKERS